MQFSAQSLIHLARTAFGPSVSVNDPNKKDGDNCHWPKLTRAARQLGLRRANGKRVRLLYGWPTEAKIIGWIQSVAPSIEWRTARAMARDVYRANDSGHFDDAWEAATQVMKYLFGQLGEELPELKPETATTSAKPRTVHVLARFATTPLGGNHPEVSKSQYSRDRVNAPPELVPA
jgi:hypothetical protein